MTFPWLKADLALQVDIPGSKQSLVQIVIHGPDRHIELRMVGQDLIRRLSLNDQRGYDLILLMELSFGQIDAGSGRTKGLAILSVSEQSIVKILMSDGAMRDLFGAAIAHIRSLIEPGASLFFKAFAGFVTGRTGSTLDVADNQLLAGVGLAAMVAMNAEVMGIIEGPFMIPIGYAVRPHFLGDGSRVLTKEACDILKGSAVIQLGFNVLAVIKSQVFLVPGNRFTHGVLLLLLPEGKTTIAQNCERVNIFCAGLNATACRESGI